MSGKWLILDGESEMQQKKPELQAKTARDAILEGYRDAIAGRVVEYRGNLKKLLKKVKK